MEDKVMRITVCCSPPKRKPAHNSTYEKLAVQWLNEALCRYVAESVLAESLVLPCRQAGKPAPTPGVGTFTVSKIYT